MTATSCTRSRWRTSAGAMRAVTLLAAVAGKRALAGVFMAAGEVSVRARRAGWPHTVQAFTTDTQPAGQDGCVPLAGPATNGCEHGTTTRACASHRAPGRAGTAWPAVPTGAGTAALATRRLRNAAGRRRR